MSKLLLIDDEREFVEMLSVVLKRAGNQMLEAFNGEDGIKIAKKDSETISRSFDLEVADYITKPFENSVLLEKIKKALSPRR